MKDFSDTTNNLINVIKEDCIEYNQLLDSNRKLVSALASLRPFINARGGMTTEEKRIANEIIGTAINNAKNLQP